MRRTIAVLAAVLFAGAAGARAQGMRPADWPLADVELGYSYLHDDNVAIGGVDSSYWRGWQAAVGINVTPAVAVVADASGHYQTTDVVPGSEAGDLKVRIHGFHGGLRLTGRGMLRPYAQLLAGVTRTAVDIADEPVSATDFSLQPGVGVMYPLTDSLSFGFGLDYRLIFTDPDKTHEWRAHAGVVLHISG
jgi:opacity protein-like surface antigen